MSNKKFKKLNLDLPTLLRNKILLLLL